jgi:hypothetical protein
MPTTFIWCYGDMPMMVTSLVISLRHSRLRVPTPEPMPRRCKGVELLLTQC